LERLDAGRAEQAPAAAAAAGAGPAPVDPLLATAPPKKIPFPAGLEPVPEPLDHDDPDAALPEADVVVITWTADEVSALARILTPGRSAARWQHYARNFASQYADRIRPHAPALNAHRLGS